MSAFRDAVYNVNGERARQQASAAVLEQTIIKVSATLAEARALTEETRRLIDAGDRDEARTVALRGREKLLGLRRTMCDDITTAVSLLQGEKRREAYVMFQGLYDSLNAVN